MKKVLFLMKFMKGGGAEKVLLNILENLDKTQFDITLMIVFNEGIYLNKIPHHINFKYMFENEDNRSNDLIKHYSHYIYNTFINEKYDVEIAFLEGICTKIISESTQLSKKIAWVHIDLLNCHYTKFLYNNLAEEETVYKKFVSKIVEKNFYQLFPLLNTKGEVLYNPIDIQNILHNSKKKNIHYKMKTFLSIGRLTDQKGFDRLIYATYRLSHHYQNFQVIILGEGPKYEKLEEQIKSLNMEKYVLLKGFKKNPYPYIRSADVFISSSRSEGLALVLCEALILNKTIIATDCSGVREALNNGEYGLIVENTEEGIYLGMKKYLDENFNFYIPKKIYEKFSIENTINKIENIIK